MTRPYKSICRGGWAHDPPLQIICKADHITRPYKSDFYRRKLAAGITSAPKNRFLAAPKNCFCSSETFHPANMVLPKQYRNNEYRKYYELMNVLAVKNQNICSL